MSSSDSAWSERRQAARPWKPEPGPVLFLVPHPDDETLMMGGLVQSVLGDANFKEVVIVAVTDGEAAYPNAEAKDLAATRCREQQAALRVLSANRQAAVERLGLPDSQVASHELAISEHVEDVIGPEWLVVAPWRHDHHSDHEACGRAAHASARKVGCRLAEGLFWAWQHPVPEFLPSLRCLRLGDTEVRRRRSALDAHASQFAPGMADKPIFDSADIEPMAWHQEYYILNGWSAP